MSRLPPAFTIVAVAALGAVTGVVGALLSPLDHEVEATVALAQVPRVPFAGEPSVTLLGAASMVPLVTARPVVESLLRRRDEDVQVRAESVSNEVLRITAVGPDVTELEELVETLAGQVLRVQQAELQRFRNAVAAVPVLDPVNVAWLALETGPARMHPPARLGPLVTREVPVSGRRAALAGGSTAGVLAWLLGRLRRRRHA